ncbi:MAG: putative porin [Smithella sp.]
MSVHDVLARKSVHDVVALINKGLKKMNGQEREIMKRHNVKAATIPVTGTRRHIHEGILVLLGLIIFGCATAPKPLIIKHQNAPYQGSASVSRTQNQKDTADGSSTSLVELLKKKLAGLLKKKNVVRADESDRFTKERGAANSSEDITALVELLKKKNVVSADEAGRFTKEKGAVTSSEDVAALVELLKKKNVVSADEAGRFVKKSEIPATPEKVTATASEEINDKEQSGKIPEGVSEEMKEDTPDQVKNDEQEEVSSEAAEAENDKEPNEKTPAGVNEELKNDPPDQVKRDEQKDVPLEAAKDDKEQSGKIPEGVSQELKEDAADAVNNDEQKDILPEDAKSDNELNEIVATGVVGEGVNKDPANQVKDDENEDVPRDVAKEDKEQSGKTPASGSEELKEDSPDAVNNDEQKDVTPEVTTRINDAQVDEIMDGVKEELKSDIHEQVYNQVKEMLRTEIPGELKKTDLTPFLPDWMKRIRLFADARLRYEYVSYDKQNYNEVPERSQGAYTGYLLNTWADTDSFKYRIRFGVESINPYVDAVIRLSTGSTTNPISTNTVFGDYLNKDAVVFDLAYVKIKPWDFLSIYGGRMPNPWFSTDLVWDTDLNFEGLALAVRNPVKQSLVPFLTIGAFPLQQSGPTSTLDFSQHNKWLYAAQTGLEIKNTKGISAQAGAAYYLFSNITGERNETDISEVTDWSSPKYNQYENTIFRIDQLHSYKFGLAAEFKELNITGALDIGFWDPVHVVFTGDYVRNIGFNKDDVAARTGLAEPDQAIDGYKIGLSVGYPKIQEFGQWKASLNYKYLGRDAVVDAFTDSDFSLGTNAKGWILGAELGLTKNMWLTTRWVSTNEISGPPLAIDLFQVDLNVSF